jgi:hypothetical protein
MVSSKAQADDIHKSTLLLSLNIAITSIHENLSVMASTAYLR